MAEEREKTGAQMVLLKSHLLCMTGITFSVCQQYLVLSLYPVKATPGCRIDWRKFFTLILLLLHHALRFFSFYFFMSMRQTAWLCQLTFSWMPQGKMEREGEKKIAEMKLVFSVSWLISLLLS